MKSAIGIKRLKLYDWLSMGLCIDKKFSQVDQVEKTIWNVCLRNVL